MNFGRLSLDNLLINRVLWTLTLLMFVLGITLPMFSLEKFFILKDAFSLLGGIFKLLMEGELFLFAVITIFSVIGPLYKLLLLWKINNQSISSALKLSLVKRLMLVGKWSMADVFLIAVLASTVKLGGLASIKVHIGLLFFGVSVIMSLVLSHRALKGYELKPIGTNE